MFGNLIVFVGFVYGAVSISDYTASNGEMIGKVESTYKAEVIAKFNVLFQYLPALREIPVRTGGVPTDISTGYLERLLLLLLLLLLYVSVKTTTLDLRFAP